MSLFEAAFVLTTVWRLKELERKVNAIEENEVNVDEVSTVITEKISQILKENINK